MGYAISTTLFVLPMDVIVRAAYIVGSVVILPNAEELPLILPFLFQEQRPLVRIRQGLRS